MARLIFTFCSLMVLVSCQKGQDASYFYSGDENIVLGSMVNEVSTELKDIGFKVDKQAIKIEIKNEEEASATFNQIMSSSNTEEHNIGLENSQAADSSSSRLAFYDANSKTIIFKEGASKNLSKGYLAHELAHVYQDQTWGLKNIWSQYRENPSQELFNITQYVVEGYAELARQAYEQAHALNPIAISDLTLTLGKVFDSECVVCHIENSTSNLPYSMGMRFLLHMYKIGGWALVEQNLKNLPASSEQILHPDKYLHDEPKDVFLPNWEPKNFTADLVYSGPMGEAFLLTKLILLNVPKLEAFTSASGWGGDMAHSYKLSDGREVLVWRIVFDRVVDATQFETSLNQYDLASRILRVGRVIDWIITDDEDILSELRIVLSKNTFSPPENYTDDESTLSQELSGRRDASYFHKPTNRTRIFVGPNKDSL